MESDTVSLEVYTLQLKRTYIIELRHLVEKGHIGVCAPFH